MTMDIDTLSLYKQALLDALIHQKGIQHIINIGFKFLENPILFNDASSKIIARSTCHKSIGHYWDDHIKRGYFSDDAMYSSKFKKISEKVDRSNSPILIKGMDDNNMIIGKITIDYIVIGYISVTDAERPFKDLDIELFSLLCDVIETEMRNDKFYKYAKGNAYEGFLKDLLDNNIKDSELVMNKVRSLNWDVDSEAYILAFDVKQYSQKKLPLSYLIYKISSIIPENKSLIYNNHIVLIINERIKTDLLGDQSKLIRNFLQKNNLYAGLSHYIADFTNLQYYYKQSLKAIELGTSLNIEKALYSYENYIIYDLLNSYSNYENLEKFCHPSLYSLIQYDQKNNTCLTQSLYVYLMNKENQSVSANILHIHRASMFYRIDKMEKIMKLKLDDANIIHHLYLSFHILKLLYKDEFIFKQNN